jgi:hypothetical protein
LQYAALTAAKFPNVAFKNALEQRESVDCVQVVEW